jgi:hypothetical protein
MESTTHLSYRGHISPSLRVIYSTEARDAVWSFGLEAFTYNDINPRSSRRNITRLQIPRLVPLDNLDSLVRCHGGGVIIA